MAAYGGRCSLRLQYCGWFSIHASTMYIDIVSKQEGLRGEKRYEKWTQDLAEWLLFLVEIVKTNMRKRVYMVTCTIDVESAGRRIVIQGMNTVMMLPLADIIANYWIDAEAKPREETFLDSNWWGALKAKLMALLSAATSNTEEHSTKLSKSKNETLPEFVRKFLLTFWLFIRVGGLTKEKRRVCYIKKYNVVCKRGSTTVKSRSKREGRRCFRLIPIAHADT